jgi:FkbM family methyltransferase
MFFLKKILPPYVKTFLKEEIRRIAPGESLSKNLESRIASLEHQLESRLGWSRSINNWYEPNIYEASVNLALRDLCQPGSIVFDVGANEGWLTLLISRLVGPKGIVCAFEANPHILDVITKNLVSNGCNNFYINHACVWKTSGEVLDFYIPPDHSQGASLYQAQYHPKEAVKTIALDDFIMSQNLEPSVVKMDIEGAEFEALQGTKEYISRSRPHLILEQSTHDGRCLDFLQNKGYLAIDLNNYRFISSINDYPENSLIRNVLFIHRDRIEETPYSLNLEAKHIADFSSTNFRVDNDKVFVLEDCINLNEGRYAIVIDFEAEREDNTISLAVYANNVLQVNYGGNTKWIKNSYSDFILNLDKPKSIKIEIRFIEGFDPTFNINSVSVSQVMTKSF